MKLPGRRQRDQRGDSWMWSERAVGGGEEDADNRDSVLQNARIYQKRKKVYYCVIVMLLTGFILISTAHGRMYVME